MTPDKTPTDSKIMREADKVGGLFDDLAIGYQSDDILKFARAVLAKWGSPVVAGEPVAWRLKDEEASRHYGKEIYVYYGKEDFQEGVDPCDFIAGIEALTTPTPTQTQAGAVPLTPSQYNIALGCATDIPPSRYEAVTRAIERAHGIKEGGQHG